MSYAAHRLLRDRADWVWAQAMCLPSWVIDQYADSLRDQAAHLIGRYA